MALDLLIEAAVGGVHFRGRRVSVSPFSALDVGNLPLGLFESECVEDSGAWREVRDGDRVQLNRLDTNM